MKQLTRVLLSAPALVLLSAGCHFSLASSSHPTVDGIELEESHEETLEPTTLATLGLRVNANMGNVRIERSDGPDSISVELFERTPGDAYAVFENGELKAESHSGDPAALGDVTVRTSGTLPHVHAETGLGDVTLEGVTVLGAVELSTGMGDVELAGAGEVDALQLSTGMGDLRAEDVTCTSLVAETGMGDVIVSAVRAPTGDISTGIGDVDVIGCTFGSLAASTGIGDVSCENCEIEEPELDSGLGSARLR